jgi:hypothetical protein
MDNLYNISLAKSKIDNVKFLMLKIWYEDKKMYSDYFRYLFTEKKDDTIFIFNLLELIKFIET